MVLVNIGLALGSVALLTMYIWKMKRPRGLPPGPMAIPILGSIPFIGLDFSTYHPNIWLALSKITKYGGIFSIAVGKKWIVVLNEFPVIKEALVKNNVVTAGRRHQDLLRYRNPYFPKHGMVHGSYSKAWKQQKSVTMQVLRRLGLGRDVTQRVIVEEMEIMTKTFQSMSSQAIDFKDHMSNAVSNVIISILIGQRYDYEEKELKHLRRLVHEMFDTFWNVMLTYDMTGASLLPSHQRNLKALIKVHSEFAEFFQSILKKVAVDLEAEEPRNFIEGYQYERSKNPQLENRIFQLAGDFIIGGFETTTSAITWCILVMLHYPEIEKKVQDEIDKVVGRTRKPTLADRGSLPYVEATILECLRFCKMAPGLIPHNTIERVSLGGYSIPKDTELWINIWGIQSDPELFPEPDVFKPERFLDENGKVVKPEEFIIFGLGHRACVGEQLAKQELFLFFTHLLHSFTLRIADGSTIPELCGKVAVVHFPPDFKIMVTSRL